MPAIVFTCEHATHAVPPPLHALGLPTNVLSTHVGWDPGALAVARQLARGLAAPLHVGRWSRLVADLNRSADHPRVIAARVSGRRVPGNTDLDAAGRELRLARYWRPYRHTVERAIAAATPAPGGCLHLSVHSFVERLGGVERTNDLGLLFDPRRPRERAMVVALQTELRRRGFSVRKNFPYFGHTDGFTSALRAQHPRARYLGIEIELNQRLARHAAGQRRLGLALLAALQSVLAGAS